MLARLFGRSIGYCAAVCVLLLFLFPLVHGPFQATHGPTTAFRDRTAAIIVTMSIITAAILGFGRSLARMLSQFAGTFSGLSSPGRSVFDHESCAILRC
jgi:hypothetical protein